MNWVAFTAIGVVVGLVVGVVGTAIYIGLKIIKGFPW